MYAVIVGGGKVGYYLTKTMLAKGHEVTVIEREERKSQRFIDEFGSIVVLGDGCDPVILEEAGLNRADVLIAVTGDDEDNLVVCQIAKKHFKVGRTIARVVNPKNMNIFNKLGIDASVSATDIISSLIEQEVITQEIIPLVSLKKGALEIVEIRVPPESPVLNTAIKDLTLPAESILISIIRGEQIIIPKGDTTFLPQDTVLALTSRLRVEELQKIFYKS